MRRTPFDSFFLDGQGLDESNALIKSKRKPIPFLFDQAITPMLIPYFGEEMRNGAAMDEHAANGTGAARGHAPASGVIIDIEPVRTKPQPPMPPLKFARYYTQSVWKIMYEALQSFSFLPRA